KLAEYGLTGQPDGEGGYRLMLPASGDGEAQDLGTVELQVTGYNADGTVKDAVSSCLAQPMSF
ncbi:MAG: hypothetical protein KAS36_10675, partial [Anaerolineales bacterium]|nr:hypothetical protein [Anaerolineales bacterium]